MVVVVPSTVEARPSTKGLVQDMSQVILKVGEIKGLKQDIEKLKQEMKQNMRGWLSSKRKIKLCRKE
jgi:hypothetical protein